MLRRALPLAFRSVLVATFAAPAANALAPPHPAAPATSYVWVGSSQDHSADNHSWGDQRNWQPQGVPQSGDSVSIAPPDGSHCVAHVDGVPSGVSLQDFSLSVGAFCGASISGGSLSVTGQLSWDSGVIATAITLPVGAHGTISGQVTGNPRKILQQSMNVAGSLTMADANLQIDAPQVLTISPTGSMHLTDGTLFTSSACCVNPAHIVVDGTIQTAGQAQVQGVQLDLGGDVIVDADARLQTVAAPMTAADGTSYSGAGTLALYNQTVARLDGTQHLASGFHLLLGNDGTTGSSLGGTVTLTGLGTLDWTGGTLMANLTVSHQTSVHVFGANPGNGHRRLSGSDSSSGQPVPSTLVNHGVFVVDGDATIQTSDVARLRVASDGILKLLPGARLDAAGCCVNPDQVVNDHGVVTVPTPVDGAGPVVLDHVAYIAQGGTTKLARSAVLQLTGGPQSAMVDATIAGSGHLTVQDPTAVSGTQQVLGSATLELGSGGSLNGTATFTDTGSMLWTGGALSGVLDIATAHLTLRGPLQKTVANVGGGSDPSSVTVHAAATMTKGKAKKHNLLNVGSSTLTLAGSTTIGGFADLDGGRIVNTGSLTVNAGDKGTVFTHVNLDVLNQGTFTLSSGSLSSDGSYTQSKGTTVLGANTTATFTFGSNPLTMAGGTLRGSGTVVGTVTNSGGTVDPGDEALSVETLTIDGTYNQAAGGKLHLDLADSGNDVLVVEGSATLAGDLVANNLAGYSPHGGDRRTTVTATANLAWNVGCLRTTGSGSKKGHWEPAPTSLSLDVVWRRGLAGC